MSPPDVEQSSSVLVHNPPNRVADRRKRQTVTFLSLFGFVLLIGLIALGNWLEWWTLGGRAQAVAVSCPAQTFSPPSETRVNVYNGTERSGLASAVAKELQSRQFAVGGISTQQQAKPLKYIAVIRYGPAGARAARTIAMQFPGQVKLILVKNRRSATVDLVIGEKYKRMMTRPKSAAAIKMKAQPDGCVEATTPSTSVSPAA